MHKNLVSIEIQVVFVGEENSERYGHRIWHDRNNYCIYEKRAPQRKYWQSDGRKSTMKQQNQFADGKYQQLIDKILIIL